MIPANGNARLEPGAGQSKSDNGNFTPTLETIKGAASNFVWVLSYGLEEARQRYADRRQPLRQAAACIALALLQICGVRHD